MSELRMARFGQGYVQTQVLSENNSVKYKLEFTGGVPFSTPSNSYITFQDAAIGTQQDGVGINTREYNPATNTLGEFKSFIVTADDNDPGTKAFLQYMATLSPTSPNLLLITTGDRLRSSDSVDAKFKSMSSVVWPNKALTSKCHCFYAGVYSIKANAMLKENVSYSDGRNEARDLRPIITYVYDKSNDIGATGFARRAVEDTKDYTVDKSNPTKRFPVQLEQVSPIASYGLKPGDILMFSVHLFGDVSLGTTGQTLRANLRWFNGTSYLSGISVEISPSDLGQWIPFARNTTVPPTADGFTIIISRYPEILDSVGSGQCRNMVLSKVSRAIEGVMDPAQIGVYGIRMNSASSVDVDENTLLVLPDTEDDKSGIIYSSDFKEFQD